MGGGRTGLVQFYVTLYMCTCTLTIYFLKGVSYIDTRSRFLVDWSIKEGGHPHGNFCQIRICQFSYRCLVNVPPFVMIQGRVMSIRCLATNVLYMDEERE